MRSIVVSVLVISAATFGQVSSSSAASPTVAKRTVSAPANKYWLSDGLNRLVFWQPQSAVRRDRANQ